MITDIIGRVSGQIESGYVQVDRAKAGVGTRGKSGQFCHAKRMAKIFREASYCPVRNKNTLDEAVKLKKRDISVLNCGLRSGRRAPSLDVRRRLAGPAPDRRPRSSFFKETGKIVAHIGTSNTMKQCRLD